MGFILHFYIIFGTNLLTGGPARIAVFCLFQYFEEKEYQTESKRNETFGSDLFGTNAIQETWSGRQEAAEAAKRQEEETKASDEAKKEITAIWQKGLDVWIREVADKDNDAYLPTPLRNRLSTLMKEEIAALKKQNRHHASA